MVPNKKGDIGMEVYYLCQSNTYVIAITAAHHIHKQLHRCWVDIGSIPPFLCLLFYLEQIFLPSLVHIVVSHCILHFQLDLLYTENTVPHELQQLSFAL